MKHQFFFISLLAIITLGCDDDNQNNTNLPFEDPVYTDSIDFTGPDRIYYTITGPTWEDDNLQVNETVFAMGEGSIDPETGLVVPEISHLAAYCSDATAYLSFYPVWKGEETIPEGSYTLSGKLIDPLTQESSPFFSVSGDLAVTNGQYLPIEVTAAQLPPLTAKLHILEITHEYTVNQSTYTQVTRMELAQVWKCPLPGTPLYEKIIRWGCEWIDGHIEDEGQISENVIADTLLTSMVALEPLGYRYGPFPRPSNFDDRAEVFLDFKQSACGEFRGFFMALVETQGIDANWLWFWFNQPSSTEYSMYQTIELPALGTSSVVWRYSDHIVVQVNGIVYDPTYLLIKENPDEYEDYIFASFCLGEDEPCYGANSWCTIPDGPQGECIDNPPGYTEGVSPPRFTGEDYR
ncbi:MAG: hypothetical protein PF689_11685 [Deltaproteobacteria bacterium]|jgi:hypothetical protein|nr:hypothetical protein [Deltaproteobacteria bacterium]